MTYNSGTSTDYIDLLDQLVQVATSRNLASIAVNAGGANYVVGEIVDISPTGSTSTHVAQIEVVTVAAGVITAARVYRGGAYTVDPTTIVANVSTSTGFTFDGTATTPGTGATFDLTFAATGWSQLTRSSDAVSATVGAAGNGYNIGDVLTVVGGVLSVAGGAAATFTVATLTGGAGTGVATVTLTTAGDYEVQPTNAVLTTNSGGGDNACTLNVTWQDLAGDTVVVLQGDAGSSIDPLVGIHTWSELTDETGANTVYNWSLHGMTAWSSVFGLHDQANILKDGFDVSGDGTITTTASGNGAWVPLKDNTGSPTHDMTWWCSVTGRRIIMVVKVTTASTTYYAQMAFGLLNSMGTITEVPFPMFIAGASDRPRVWYGDTSAIWGGLGEVIERAKGPAYVWAVEGSWINVKNAAISVNQDTTPAFAQANVAPRAHVWPLGNANTHQTIEDGIWTVASGTGFDNADLTLATNAMRIYRTPDTGGDLFPLFPITYNQQDSASGFFRVFGEVDGVFWLDQADSGLSSEDRLSQTGERYSIFQNGTQINPWSFIALRED